MRFRLEVPQFSQEWKSFTVFTLGDDTTNKIEALNRVTGYQLTGYERMSVTAEKLFRMAGK